MWPETTERLTLHTDAFAKKKKWLGPKFLTSRPIFLMTKQDEKFSVV